MRARPAFSAAPADLGRAQTAGLTAVHTALAENRNGFLRLLAAKAPPLRAAGRPGGGAGTGDCAPTFFTDDCASPPRPLPLSRPLAVCGVRRDAWPWAKAREQGDDPRTGERGGRVEEGGGCQPLPPAIFCVRSSTTPPRRPSAGRPRRGPAARCAAPGRGGGGTPEDVVSRGPGHEAEPIPHRRLLGAPTPPFARSPP